MRAAPKSLATAIGPSYPLFRSDIMLSMHICMKMGRFSTR